MRAFLHRKFAAALCALSLVPLHSAAQTGAHPAMDSYTRAQAHGMLRDGYEHIRKDYYDPAFHGVDLDGRYAFYNTQIDNAQTLGQAFGLISTFLSEFKDSHLFFMPPRRPVLVDPGYEMAAVADQIFVTRVRPGTDAASKLHPGSTVVQFGGFHVTRRDLPAMERYFHYLAPSPEDRLVVQGPGGAPNPVTIANVVKPRKRLLDVSTDYLDLVREGENDDHKNRERIYESGDVIIWKMSRFDFDVATLDRIFGKAQKHGTLIIDLRDNGGGSVQSLQDLVGRLFVMM